MTDQYWVLYTYSGRACAEGPYTFDEARRRIMEIGVFSSEKPTLQTKEDRNAR